MRKLILLALVSALFLAVLPAQAKLPRPDKPTLAQSEVFPDCVAIQWPDGNIKRKYKYEVRLTKVGTGKLQYTADSNPARRHVGWTWWQKVGPHVLTGGVFYADQCGLVSGQKIKARVRVVNARGRAGRSSRSSDAYVVP